MVNQPPCSRTLQLNNRKKRNKVVDVAMKVLQSSSCRQQQRMALMVEQVDTTDLKSVDLTVIPVRFGVGAQGTRNEERSILAAYAARGFDKTLTRCTPSINAGWKTGLFRGLITLASGFNSHSRNMEPQLNWQSIRLLTDRFWVRFPEVPLGIPKQLSWQSRRTVNSDVVGSSPTLGAYRKRYNFIGDQRSLISRLLWEQKIVGLNPTSPTIFKIAGSIPLDRPKKGL